MDGGFPSLQSPVVNPLTGTATQPWYRLFLRLLTQTSPGIITIYGGGSAPSGTLPCDGSAVSRTTYSALFSVVGTTFGVGDGSTTFNVPTIADADPGAAYYIFY